MDTLDIAINSNIKQVFIIFESRYEHLNALINTDDTGRKTMGEVIWFYSFMKHLIEKEFNVIHCKDLFEFLQVYCRENKDGTNIHLIMDCVTIPKTIEYLSKDISKIYCMCYWGRNSNSVKNLGSINNNYISLSNVLTPFNYSKKNSYLGYDVKYLCNSYDTKKYKNIGILWGKNIKYINLDILQYLTDAGLEFYSVTNTPINIKGVINLGILTKELWCQLLNDGKYILSFGRPKSGPTILEALFYKKILFGPKKQYPESIHNKNIYFTDNLTYQDIYDLIDENCQFIEDDETCNLLVSSDNFNQRVQNIFFQS